MIVSDRTRLADATPLDSSSAGAPTASSGEDFDIVATYQRLLADDPDLTKPIAAIEALIEVLRHTPSSTAMETYEISEAQVQRLHAAVPNSLPIEAGTRMFTSFISMTMRQPVADTLSSMDEAGSAGGGGGGANGSGSGNGGSGAGSGAGSGSASRNDRSSLSPPPPESSLDSFEKIRQHLLDNSQLFVQRAKAARDRIAERGCRLVRAGDVVMTTGGSRAVRALFLRAAARLRAAAVAGHQGLGPVPVPAAAATAAAAISGQAGKEDTPSPFTVLYVCDERSRAESERHMAVLRQHHIDVVEIDPSAVAYALEVYAVRAVFVGSEAVTHDGKLVSRIGTYQLALLAHAATPACHFFVLAETHKFVRKLLLNNEDLGRIGVQQGFAAADGTAAPKRMPRRPRLPVKPQLPFHEQVDVTPPSLVTNFVTENAIIQPWSSYRIVSY